MKATKELIYSYACGDYRELVIEVNYIMYHKGISLQRLAKVAARMLGIPVCVCESELRRMAVN